MVVTSQLLVPASFGDQLKVEHYHHVIRQTGVEL